MRDDSSREVMESTTNIENIMSLKWKDKIKIRVVSAKKSIYLDITTEKV